MISFRYLVVTIVSIFLALGLGILAGTTAINQVTVKTLKARTHAAERDRDRYLRQRNQFSTFLTELLPDVVNGRLAHTDVVLIADDNADGAAVSEVRSFLGTAGATIVADLTVTSRLDRTNPASAGLQQVLASSGASSSGDPSMNAARDLAGRLESGVTPQPGTTAGRKADLLGQLLDGGYLVPAGGAPNLSNVGGPGQLVVVVGGGVPTPAVPYDSFLVPFVEQLVRDGIQVAAAEPMKTNHPFVGLLRGDGSISSGSPIVTVDDLDSGASFGGVALILGLKELIRFGQGGNYGTKDGASSLLPKLP